ncbi:MAG: hypothetical protein FJ410_09275 [Verrucomicrobia bacterium]|nr:hypothetical protein [Verrucomicrobiota bacterium]
MSTPLSKLLGEVQRPPGAALVPATRFFVRRIPIDGDDVAGQVALALETASPFPVEQMLVGHVTAADGRSALAYAAHRRRFTTEESFAWPDDCQVVPEFLALCGHRPTGDGVTVHRGKERLIALAWKADEPLPAAILSAERADADEAALAREAAERGGLSEGWTTETLSGALVGDQTEAQLALRAEDGRPYVLLKRALDDADIRDADFLSERRKKERVNLVLWNLVRASAAVLATAALLDAAGLFLGWRNASGQATVDGRRELVADLESAQAVSNRILEMGAKRPLPLEMLALINEHRPSAVEFQQVTCKSNVLLEVEARTANAGDIGEYEKALSVLPEVASVVSSDIRARDSNTTFSMTVTFRLDALRKAVAAAKQTPPQ